MENRNAVSYARHREKECRVIRTSARSPCGNVVSSSRPRPFGDFDAPQKLPTEGLSDCATVGRYVLTRRTVAPRNASAAQSSALARLGDGEEEDFDKELIRQLSMKRSGVYVERVAAGHPTIRPCVLTSAGVVRGE